MTASQKKHLRLVMKEKRAMLFQQTPEAGEKVSTLFFKNFHFPSSTVVGGYWPIGNELDLRPLLKKLMEKGFKCALPSVTPQGLEFHLWTESIPLVKRAFQIFEPLTSSPSVVPHVLFVPLLAFDKHKHRLGYGQGHFDYYLHARPLVTIGIGFSGQEVEKIPAQTHDFALDYILTEKGLLA
jgi:5-formyltetrahydrofolate cyclo-ligase